MLNRAQRRLSSYPTDVYRAYSADGRLLYVGASVNVFQRLRAHRAYSPWYGAAVRVVVHRYEDRAMAREVEETAIRDEHPEFNVVREPSMIGRTWPTLTEEPLTLTRDAEEWVVSGS